MDDRAKELSDAIDRAEKALHEAKKAYWAYLTSQSPYAAGDIIKFGKERTEGMVVGIEFWIGETRPRVVTRKKNGEWGTRETPIWRVEDIEIVSSTRSIAA